MSAKQDANEIKNYILSRWPHEQVILPASTGDDSGPIYGSLPKEYAGYKAFEVKSFSSPTEIKNFLSDISNNGFLKIDNGLTASLQNILQSSYKSAVKQFVDAPIPVYNNINNALQVDNTSKPETPAPKANITPVNPDRIDVGTTPIASPGTAVGDHESVPAQIPEQQQSTFYTKLAEAQTAAKNGDSKALSDFNKYFGITEPTDGSVPNSGGRGAVDPTPGGDGATQSNNSGGQAASAPAQTQEQQQATFYAKLAEAQAAAKNGDSQALRNFDSFFSITRPEAEYTQAFYNAAAPTTDINARIAQIVGDPNLGWNIKSKIVLEIQAGNTDTNQNLTNWFNGGNPPSAAAADLGATAQGKLNVLNALPVGVASQVRDEIEAGNPDSIGNLIDWFGNGNPPSSLSDRQAWTPTVDVGTPPVVVAPDPFAGGPADASAGAVVSQVPESTTVTADEKTALGAGAGQSQSYPTSTDDIMPKAVEAAQRVISDSTSRDEPMGGTVAGGTANPYTSVVPPTFTTKP